MSKKRFLAGFISVMMLSGCHHHSHEHGESDEHGHHHEEMEEVREEHDEESHDHGTDYHNEEETGHRKHEGEVHLSEAEMLGISTDTMAFADFSQVVVASGEILPTTKGEVSVTAPFSGIVNIAQGVSVGGKVASNQSLFYISTNVGESSGLVEKAAIELEAARKEYESDVRLSEEKIVSQKELSECRERYEQAKMRYDNLASKITSGQAMANSTIAGFVKSISVSDGSYVNAGDLLAVVTQTDKLMLLVKLPQRYQSVASSVRTVKFRTTYSDKVFSLAKMAGRQVSQVITTSDGGYYIPLHFEFKNMENVMAGTSVECYVVTNTRKTVLTVPNEAIAEEQGVPFVFVKKHEDAFKKQFVKLGATDGERTEIIEGLRSGDIVATSEVSRLHLASSSNAIPAHSHSH